MKRIYKFGTGMDVPEGSIYLTTLTEIVGKERLVWHYFLVEVASWK